MDADDAQLVRIYTAPTGTFLESNTPNAATPTAATSYDVVIEALAGSAKGNNGQGYNLRFDAQELTQPPASTAAFNGALAQSFNAGSVGSPWTALPNGNFRNVIQRNIAVLPADRGRVLQYTASLLTTNNDVASFVQSEPFLIV